MLHLVCDCGALLTLPPTAGGRTVSCRSCGATRPVPDPAALGLSEHLGSAGPPVAALDPAPDPAPVPASATAPLPAHHAPSFGRDDRLDLPSLERHAARMGALSVLVWVAGVLGAAGAFALSSRTDPERALLAVGCLFAALLASAGFRAARASALAAVALAQRQREMLQGMER